MIRARVVPALMLVTVLVVTVAAAYLDSLTTDAQRTAADLGRGALTATIGLMVTVAAAAILAARPRHVVGVVLAALGLVWNLDGLAESWAARSLAHDLPGTDAAYWFVARFGAFLLTGLVVLLLVYPSGRLIAGRLRPAAVGVLALASLLPLGLLVAPDAVVFQEGRPAGVRTDFLGLPMSDAAAEAVLGVASVGTMLAVLGALVLLVLRHRGAAEEERTQLRWLLWAGILCLLAALVILLVGPGTVSTAILAVAVLTVSASVAVGVVKPDLADVDSLVAGTLTYAGVAAIVVGVDLAVLAIANELLGSRLDERDVTLLVLVLAVAVYGPLRTWLGGWVRRLMFGRRGDRYGVVSTFAARLEDTDSVQEQLPTLVSAVASTFKVPFVRVEVIVPGGRVLSADHGLASAEEQELEIAYRGEQIGRLVLSGRGVRSMLSRRDQDLLVDLVRQAAIAVRSSLLAEEVQDSRERLVLAREDDRRRIRRDLHDGLGPVLGGVAMRLDAAGNAVESDPESARRLIRQSRTEIRDALDDVRRLVHDLRPPALDDLGLLAAIEQQAERASSQLSVDVDADDITGLPAAVEVAAYRIVSESLANVVKHSGATRCTIRLVPGERALEIEVSDDGRGIEPDVAAGVGLLSLRERADELGGQCQVTCPESGGTRVTAWLPYGRVLSERMS